MVIYVSKSIMIDTKYNLKMFQWERRGNLRYSQENIDEVRNEWAKFVVNTYV